MGYLMELVVFLLLCLVFGWQAITGILAVVVFLFCCYMIGANVYCWVRGY